VPILKRHASESSPHTTNKALSGVYLGSLTIKRNSVDVVSQQNSEAPEPATKITQRII
jgi:hypothetical protein